MRVGCQRHALATLLWGRRHSTHYGESWVGPRTSLDGCSGEKISCLCWGLHPRDCPLHRKSLYHLHQPSPLLPVQAPETRLSNNCVIINHLMPNDPYMGRTAPLTSKRCILHTYSTNIGTEYFKHALYSPFFSSSKCSLFHNANLFGSCIIHILYTGCAKIKKNNSGAKRLIST